MEHDKLSSTFDTQSNLRFSLLPHLAELRWHQRFCLRANVQLSLTLRDTLARSVCFYSSCGLIRVGLVTEKEMQFGAKFMENMVAHNGCIVQFNLTTQRNSLSSRQYAFYIQTMLIVDYIGCV